MNDNVGIWIDHQRAIIVFASEGRIKTKTLESSIEAHPRYSGQQDGGGEKKYEARHGQRLDQYYDEVIGQLGQPDALLVSVRVRQSWNSRNVSADPRRFLSALLVSLPLTNSRIRRLWRR